MIDKKKRRYVIPVTQEMRKALPPKPAEEKPLPTGASRTPPKGYPEKKESYAIPAEFKYPLDSEERIRSALSYFSVPANHNQYSPEEQKAIWKRIVRAAKKHGIELSEEVLKRAGLKKAISLVIPAIIKGIAKIRGIPDGSGPEGKGPTGKKLGGCPEKEDYESDEEYQNALKEWKKRTGKSLKLIIEKSMTWSGHELQGRTEFQGLKISIENRKGSVREGVDPDGHKWRIKMKYPYGYIREFGAGEDGDHIDCYIGPDKKSRLVCIVRQQDPIKKTYDEDKVMLGFRTPGEAKKAYLAQYDNPDFFGGMDVVDIDKFKEMLKGNYESSGGRLKIKKACGRAKRIAYRQYPELSEEDEKFWKIAQKIDRNIKGGK